MKYHKTLAIEPLGIVVDNDKQLNPFINNIITELLNDNYTIIFWSGSVKFDFPKDKNILIEEKKPNPKRKCFFCIDTDKEFASKFRLYGTVPRYSSKTRYDPKPLMRLINNYKQYVDFIEENTT